MGKSAIDWPWQPLYTWNPITGCPRGCEYCVVRKRVWPRIRRLFGNHDYHKVSFQEHRLEEPLKIKKPAYFFVGFYSDIEYWPKEWTRRVLDVCAKCPRHTFLFLSKNPISYFDKEWPKNTMQGLTMTCEQDQETQYQYAINMRMHCSRPWLSIEPLLGKVKISNVLDGFKKIIVGCMTGPGAIKPERDWIKSVRSHVPADKIYWKANIRGYL